MARRKRQPARQLEADRKYSSVLVAKFINAVMKDGKKTTAERIVYEALVRAEKKGKKPGLEIFEEAIKNISPNVEIKSRRVGGASYQVPREVRGERKTTLAFRWLLQITRAGKGAPMAERMANELLAASKNEGAVIKKKMDTHRMAEANRAFAHFSW